MHYLTVEEVLVIHARLVEETSGSHGVRDTHLLQSLIERPKTEFGGTQLYLTVFEKAAAYLEAILQYHVFIDGNKRTGITVAARFLFVSGYELTATNKELEEFVLSVVVHKLDIKTIASWLKHHSKSTKKG